MSFELEVKRVRRLSTRTQWWRAIFEARDRLNENDVYPWARARVRRFLAGYGL